MSENMYRLNNLSDVKAIQFTGDNFDEVKDFLGDKYNGHTESTKIESVSFAGSDIDVKINQYIVLTPYYQFVVIDEKDFERSFSENSCSDYHQEIWKNNV